MRAFARRRRAESQHTPDIGQGELGVSLSTFIFEVSFGGRVSSPFRLVSWRHGTYEAPHGRKTLAPSQPGLELYM